MVFKSADGRRFRVIYPGRKGGGAGPDFRDAVLEEEGVGLIRGDVELHVKQKDWDAHGHGGDPRYNGWRSTRWPLQKQTWTPTHCCGAAARLLPCLSSHCWSQSAGKPLQTWEGYENLWLLLSPHGFKRPSNLEQIGRTLEEAGDARFLSKSLFFGALMEYDSPDQVVYSALMEALGYSRNRHPFFELAYNVTYGELLKTARAAPPSERTQRLESVLITEAGLSGGPVAGKVKRYPWTLSGIRPSNHPAKRIAGFSLVLDGLISMQDDHSEYDGRSLTRTLMRLVGSSENLEAATRELERTLMGTGANGDGEAAETRKPTPIGKAGPGTC